MSFFRSGRRPFLIAGPCSAESREQVMETAAALQKLPVHLFRAGVWKPRTKPGSFEGVGEQGLAWLREVKETHWLPVAVEVAEPIHVELALKYGIDVLWVGARTTVNPFQVQRIADALRGVHIPVMVKNPVTPDVDMWQGAIERLEQAGINQIAGVHRGFTGYNTPGGNRNHPNWPIPIELKRRKPELSIFCDPSHITGRRDAIAEMSQRAMDLHFEGLMIETHPHPDAALSDAAQQITPAALEQLLKKLVLKNEYSADMTHGMELEYLRQVMDSLDTEIIDLVARRMQISGEIGALKKAANMTVYQPERWREIVENLTTRANGPLNLSREFIISLYEVIHHESIKKQLAILQGTPDQNIE